MRSSLRPVFRASVITIGLLLVAALFLGGCTKEKPQTRSATPGATRSAALLATTVVTVPTAELGGELLPTLTPTIPATTISTQPTATPESGFSELTNASSVDATATAVIATAIAANEPTPTSVPVLTPLPDGTPTPFSIEPAPTLAPEWQPEEPSEDTAPQAPAGTTYVVHWGDTLYSIAVQFGVSIEDIMAVNGLASDLIVIGQELIIPAGGRSEPEPKTHEGYEWVYVLNGRLRLVLGEHDLVLEPGEAAEFDTRVPHWFGRADSEGVEFLSLFGSQGERAHLRARPRASR